MKQGAVYSQPMPAAPGVRATGRASTLSAAGRMFIAVLLIVVFEGAVRKWVASSLTLPLIGMRDLLAVAVIAQAAWSGQLHRYAKVTVPLLAWSCCVVAWGLMQMVAGESSPIVFLIGMRFWLLYIWFGVAAAASMNEADYRAAVRLVVATVMVLAPLAVLQHYSAPGATINRQLDGDEDTVFVAIAGVVRTTGTFSFTSGYATYLIMAAPLVFGVLAARKQGRRQRLFAFLGFGAFLLCSLMSGSRAAVLSAAFMLAAYLATRVLFARNRDKPAALGAALVACVLTAAFVFFLSDAVQVTQQRFEQAASGEDFSDRLLATFIGEPNVFGASTWLGAGLGAGSNLATALNASATNFGLAESETGRILLEGGLLGFAFIALKVLLLLTALVYSLRLSAQRHTGFPILVWLTLVIALMTWPAIGQLTANALLGLLLGCFLLQFRYPSNDFFPPVRLPSK